MPELLRQVQVVLLVLVVLLLAVLPLLQDLHRLVLEALVRHRRALLPAFPAL